MYKKLQKLGEGSFGAAYIVEKDDQKFVLKQIEKEHVSRKNFANEIRTLKKVTDTFKCSGFTICLHDAFEGKKYFNIITNYISNTVGLDSVIYDNKESQVLFSFDDNIFIIQRLVDQLAILHASGIVHGDIKPANILLQIQNSRVTAAFFIDFGLSCFKTCYGTGTLIYMAPEILLKLHKRIKKHQAKKADIWSLGVTFFELLNNEMPFPLESDYKRIKDISTEKYIGARQGYTRLSEPSLVRSDELLQVNLAKYWGVFPGSEKDFPVIYSAYNTEYDGINDFVEYLLKPEKKRPGIGRLKATLAKIVFDLAMKDNSPTRNVLSKTDLRRRDVGTTGNLQDVTSDNQKNCHGNKSVILSNDSDNRVSKRFLWQRSL